MRNIKRFCKATADLDLLISLDKINVQKTIVFMKRHKYFPRAPVPAEKLLDSLKKKVGTKKHLKAFTFIQNGVTLQTNFYNIQTFNLRLPYN